MRTYVTKNDKFLAGNSTPTALRSIVFDVPNGIKLSLGSISDLIEDYTDFDAYDGPTGSGPESKDTIATPRIFKYDKSISLYNTEKYNIRIGDRDKYGHLIGEDRTYTGSTFGILSYYKSGDNKEYYGDTSTISGYYPFKNISETIDIMYSTDGVARGNTYKTFEITCANSRDYLLFYKHKNIIKNEKISTRNLILDTWDPKIVSTDNSYNTDIKKINYLTSNCKQSGEINSKLNGMYFTEKYPFIVAISKESSGKDALKNLNIQITIRNIPILMEKRRVNSRYYIFMYPEWVMASSEVIDNINTMGIVFSKGSVNTDISKINFYNTDSAFFGANINNIDNKDLKTANLNLKFSI